MSERAAGDNPLLAWTRPSSDWEAVPDAVVEIAKQRILAALSDDGPQPASQRLVHYYDVEQDAVGASFTELYPNEWHAISAVDLHAASLMGAKLGPRETRRLLSGPERTWVVEALRRLPDRELNFAGPSDLESMEEFHSALEHALENPEVRRADRSLTASAIAARKRPDLFPVRDAVVRTYLAIPEQQDVRSDWQLLRRLLHDDDVAAKLLQLPDVLAPASAGRSVILEHSALRLLDSALRTYVAAVAKLRPHSPLARHPWPTGRSET